MTDNPYEPPAARPSAPNSDAAPGDGKATASLVLGIGSAVLYCLPPICIGMAVASIVLGILSVRTKLRARAVLGMTAAVVGLAFTTFLLLFIRSFPKPYQ